MLWIAPNQARGGKTRPTLAGLDRAGRSTGI
jgi:hypothetical protein